MVTALTASYLVPVALLFVSYRHTQSEQRLRLRWMLWSSVVFVVGIFTNNTPIFGFLASAMIWSLMFTVSFACILYAVLRHRVVDVAVILDRTLVYGAVTALVVGVLAAVNSVVQHAALGTNASLLLQVLVPFALGIVLYRVRTSTRTRSWNMYSSGSVTTWRRKKPCAASPAAPAT